MHPTDSTVPRPTFHFTPQRNWMNDPNGLIYDSGLWHLYFQYNPEGSDWGNMSWGHATSADLRRWSEHPVALSYRDGEQIFSGSIVASSDSDEAELTAYYTSAYDDRQAQSRAISRDGGFTWQPDTANPMLDRGTSAFRDPKIVRTVDEGGDIRWIMVAVEADDRQVLFYASPDLRSWELQSTLGPFGADGLVWECPDLIPLALDGDPDDVRWVLLLSTNPVGDDADPAGSSMSYLVGRFNGVTFTPDAPELVRLDHGRDYYAGVTFYDAPDGAAITMGWMSNWRYAAVFPSAPWRGAMSLPRRLSLRTISGRPRLIQEPPSFVREQLALADPSTVFDPAQPAELELSGHSLLELQWDPASTGILRLQLRGDADAFADLDHDPTTGALRITRGGPAAEAVHPDFPSTSTVDVGGAAPMRLLLSLDGPLLEIFVDDGRATVSSLVVLGAGPSAARVETARGGPVAITMIDLP